MGASHPVVLNGSQPSETVSGKMSITSDSLDDLDPPVAGKDAFHEALFLVQQPHPMIQPVLKSTEVTDIDANTLTVKFIMNGQQLDQYGFGKGDGTDKIATWRKVTKDESSLTLTTVELVDPVAGAFVGSPEDTDQNPFSTTVFKILSSPTRLEFTTTSHREGEENPADGPLLDGTYGWSDAIVGNVQAETSGQIKFSVGDSIQEAGQKSIISTPMEDLVSYDAFMDSWITSAKTLIGSAPNTTFFEISETEFKVTGEAMLIHAKFDRDAGTLVAETTSKDKIINVVHRVLHKSPMIMEAWDVDGSGNRKLDGNNLRLVRKNMNDVLKAATSWW